MDKLWAPWRMEYILAPRDKGCFLCDIVSSAQDRQNLVIKRGTTCIALLNRYPYNNGHVMISPTRHVAELASMTSVERAEMMELTTELCDLLTKAISPHGYNIGLNLGDVAGAGLKDHIHLHIVPRWEGDTNFMPVIGSTKIIPQALDDLWNKLVSGH